MNQIINKTKHNRFYIILVALLTTIFIRYAFQTNIPRFIYLFLIILAAAIGNPSEIMAMCMCCIPLHEVIDFFYAVVICIAFYVFKNYRHLKINTSAFAIIPIILWELLHCFDPNFSPTEFLIPVVPLVALAVFMCIDSDEYDYAFIVRVFAITTVILCITLLTKVLYASNFNFAKAILGLQRLGFETERQKLSTNTGEINPNTLGIICVLATTGLMQLRTKSKDRKSDILLAITLMVFGALTSSRTYLVCLVAMFMLLVCAQEGGFKSKLRLIGTIFMVLIIALSILYLLFPDLLQYYFSRFLEEDITTGRFTLMKIYHNFIMSDPKVLFFGIGLNKFDEKVLSVYRVTSRHVPHNGIQELVASWGLPGLVFFVALLLGMFFQSKKHSKSQKLMNFIPILILLLKIQAGQLFRSAYTMLAFSYAYLSMCQNFELEEESK